MQQSSEVKNGAAMAKAQTERDSRDADGLALSQTGRKTIAVALDNSGLYTALQTDLALPVNAADVEVKLNDAVAATHRLTCARLNAHTLRVMVYSLSNSSFLDGNAVLTLSFNRAVSANDVQVKNTVASDAEAAEYRLGWHVDETTSIASARTEGSSVQVVSGGVVISGAVDTPVCIYTTSGMLVKSFRLDAEEVRLALAEGVYLIKVNGQTTKTTVK